MLFRSNMCMIIVDFTEFGPVAPKAIDRHDLLEILASSQKLLDDFDEEHIGEFLCDTQAALMWAAISENMVDEEWYDRASIVLCMRGLRGEIAPKFLNFNAKD